MHCSGSAHDHPLHDGHKTTSGPDALLTPNKIQENSALDNICSRHLLPTSSR